MALTRQQKEKIIEQLREKIDRQKIMIFVDFSGLKAKDFFALRKSLKKVDSQFTVAKKTLLGLVFKEKEMAVDTKKLTGEIGVVFGFRDEVSPAKEIYRFSKEHQDLPKILGGFLENNFREKKEIIALASLPSRKELLAKLVGSVSAPMSGLVNVLQGNIKGLITVLAKAKT